MPELPEVEVSRLGITPHLHNQQIQKVVVRQRQLRWPVPLEVQLCEGQRILAIRRRAKYLLIDTQPGSVVMHLGMSGRLRVVSINTPVQKHDHIDIQLSNGQCLRYNDARRFGACLWQGKDDDQLTILKHLGPEPLSDEFDGEHLYQLSRKRQIAVKNYIMNNQVVVGVGNIYANEALFKAGIDPRKKAAAISRKQYLLLAEIIKQVLAAAIKQGGTTLKDFTQADGKPGYFAQSLNVYGRQGELCLQCNSLIASVVIGQRNSFYCPTCQK